ncbi:response regulator [Glaciecola siphonariae]|uniref:histidine kinase n=1 Tax=Glaciecola siphonariae TaxID=521012 RepID=A0ABV9LRD0_9ALTE
MHILPFNKSAYLGSSDLRMVIAVLLIFCFSFCANSKTLDFQNLSKSTIKHPKIANQVINDVYIDRMNYMWISTELGIYRFDGAQLQAIDETFGFDGYEHPVGGAYGVHALDDELIAINFAPSSTRVFNIVKNRYSDLSFFNQNQSYIANSLRLDDKVLFYSHRKLYLYDSKNKVLLAEREMYLKSIEGVHVYKDAIYLLNNANELVKLARDTLEPQVVSNINQQAYKVSLSNYDRFTELDGELLLLKQYAISKVNPDTLELTPSIVLPKCERISQRQVPFTKWLVSKPNKAYVNKCGIYALNRNQQSIRQLLAFTPEESQHISVNSPRRARYSTEHSFRFFFTLHFTYILNLENLELQQIPRRMQEGVRHSARWFEKQGLLWLSNEMPELSLLSEYVSRFGGMPAHQINTLLGTQRLRKVLQTKESELFVATQDKGLFQLAFVEQEWQVKQKWLENFQIRDVFLDHNRLWIGSEGGGIFYFDLASSQLHQPKYLAHFTQGFEFASFKQDHLLISLNSDGLVLINTVEERIVQHITNIEHEGVDVRIGRIRAIEVTEHNEVILGTHTNHHPNILHLDQQLKLKATHLTKSYVFDIEYLPSGEIIAATWGEGVLGFDENGKQFQISQHNGLISDVVFALEAQEVDGRIEVWASGPLGMSKLTFAHAANGTLTIENIRNFTQEDGLLTNSFDSESNSITPKGEIIFSGYGGVTKFSPANDIKMNKDAISSGRLVSITALNNTRFVSPQASLIEVPESTDEVILQFASFDYLMPNKQQYRYKIDDDEWSLIENGTLRFPQLKSGKYKISFDVANNDGVWSEEPKVYHLKVIPPWYISTSALVCYSLGLLIVIFLLIKNRQRVIESRNRELESQIALATQDLQRVIGEKEAMFEEISHEFRTPLTLILGKSEQLERTYNNDYIRVIKANAQKMYAMVNKLLKLAEIQAIKKHRVNTVVATQVELVVNNMRMMADIKGIDVELSMKGVASNLCLELIEESIDLILGNLLSNAIKYTQIGGQIHVSLNYENAHLDLCVQDNGKGFNSPESAFDRFSREESKIEGTGLGLSIVHRMTKANGGKVFISNVESGGAKVCAQLPAESVAFEPQTFTDERSHESPLPDCDILLVEDDLELQQHFVSILPNNVKLYLAESGLEALDILDDIEPDIIVTDVNMPFMDGFSFCEELKKSKQFNHIPVLFLTALSDISNQRRGMKAGAIDYISKPFSSDLLLRKINNILVFITNTRLANQSELFVAPNEYASVEDEFKDKVQAVLASYFQNEGFCLSDMASELHISEKTLNRRLKSFYALTFSQILKEYRLKQAHLMLKAGHPAKHVAFDCGFGSAAYFGKLFKERFGVTPGQV